MGRKVVVRLRHDTPASDTKPEQIVRTILELLNPPFFSQEPITVTDPTTKDKYTFLVDFLVDKKLVIAVHGSHKRGNDRAMEKISWESKLLKQAGYQILDVWDYELSGFEKIRRLVKKLDTPKNKV